MITTIGSLVQETSHRLRWFAATALYFSACLITSSLLGAILGSSGHLIHDISNKVLPHALLLPLATASIGVVAIAYAASDMGLLLLPHPRIMDAVPVSWWRWWKPYGAALAYGAALGLGIMTRIQFGAFYVLCLWCLFKGNALYGALLMGIYGAARAFTLIPASWGVYRYHGCTDSERRIEKLLGFLGSAKLILALVLLFFGAMMLTSLLFSNGSL